MSIASEITRIKTNIGNAYTALEAKGATIPSEKNSDNLAGTIDTISGGTGFTIGVPREVSSEGVYQKPTQSFTFSVPDTVTSISDQCLMYILMGSSGLKHVDMSSVVSIGGSALASAFGLTGVTTVNLSNLETVDSRGMTMIFTNCYALSSVTINKLQTIGPEGLMQAFATSSITTVDFSSLKTVSDRGLAQAFSTCASLTSVNMPSLQSVGALGMDRTFYNCYGFTSVNLDSLNAVGNSAMSQCFAGTQLSSLSLPSLNSSSFGNYTNQFYNMLQGVTSCTVHFPSNLESVIGSWPDVTNGFGGINTTVLFDLPATS